MVREEEIAWFCAYTPLEILEAAGFRPFRLLGNPRELESADAMLHPAICPYVRACLAQAMRGEAPSNAVFVNSCDGMRRLYDAWRDLHPHSFSLLLDLPRKMDERAREMLCREYRRLLEALSSFRGRAVTAEDLQEACRRVEARRLAYLRDAGALSGRLRLELAQNLQRGREEALRPGFLSGDERTSSPDEGVPVVVSGNLLNPDGLISLLESAGARVVWADLCNGDRAYSFSAPPQGKELPDLLLSLAAKYLERHPCARMSDRGKRYDLLVEAVRSTGARGVIYATLKFCDSYLYDFPRVREILRREGIPVLRLESDYADGHAGQLMTRVEAFLEMIS